jgi:O-antigen/teichoic acid export membrane protein
MGLNIIDIRMSINYSKEGFTYLIASAIQNFFPFLLLPFLINILSADEYGVYSLILTLTTLLSIFFSFGISSALGRYFYEYKDNNYLEKLINTSLNFSLLIGLIFIIIIFLFSSKISTLIFGSENFINELIFCSVASFLFIILNLFTTIFRFNFKSKKYFYVCVVSSLLNFIITLILLNHGFKILAPIFGLLFSSVLGLFISFLIIESKFGFMINPSVLKKLVLFGFPTAINGLLFYLLDWSDKFIVNDLIGTDNTGIYSFGYKIGAILNVCLIIPVQLIWGPYRIKNAKSKELSRITSKVINYYIVSGLVLILFFTLLGDSILKYVFTNKEFIFSYDIFPIIMVALLIYGLQGFVDFGIYYAKKLHFYVIVGVLGLIINWSLNYYFIPKLGLIGAAYATFFTYVFTSGFFYLVSKKYFRINFSLKLLIPITTFIMILMLSVKFDFDSLVYNLIIIVIFTFISFGAIISKQDLNFLTKKFN